MKETEECSNDHTEASVSSKRCKARRDAVSVTFHLPSAMSANARSPVVSLLVAGTASTVNDEN